MPRPRRPRRRRRSPPRPLGMTRNGHGQPFVSSVPRSVDTFALLHNEPRRGALSSPAGTHVSAATVSPGYICAGDADTHPRGVGRGSSCIGHGFESRRRSPAVRGRRRIHRQRRSRHASGARTRRGARQLLQSVHDRVDAAQRRRARWSPHHGRCGTREPSREPLLARPGARCRCRPGAASRPRLQRPAPRRCRHRHRPRRHRRDRAAGLVRGRGAARRAADLLPARSAAGTATPRTALVVARRVRGLPARLDGLHDGARPAGRQPRRQHGVVVSVPVPGPAQRGGYRRRSPTSAR